MADVAPPVADEPMAAAAPAEADAEAAAAAAAPAADAAAAPAAAPARIIIDSSQGAVSGGVSGRELAKRIKTFSDGSNIWTRKLDAETDAPEAKARRRAELNDDVELEAPESDIGDIPEAALDKAAREMSCFRRAAFLDPDCPEPLMNSGWSTTVWQAGNQGHGRLAAMNMPRGHGLTQGQTCSDSALAYVLRLGLTMLHI